MVKHLSHFLHRQLPGRNEIGIVLCFGSHNRFTSVNNWGTLYEKFLITSTEKQDINAYIFTNFSYIDVTKIELACIWSFISIKKILLKSFQIKLLLMELMSMFSQVAVWGPQLFSSPEHEVLSELLWSFNVRRPLSVRASVNNFFKQHLLWNRLLDFDQTSQKWSLGGPLSKLFKLFQLVA